MYSVSRALPQDRVAYVYPDEKDCTNMRLVQVLVGTTWISTDIHEILTEQCLVIPKRTGASGSKINDDCILILKVCSG